MGYVMPSADDNDVDGELETWLSMATSTSTVSTTGQAGDDRNDGDEEDELGVVAAGALSRYVPAWQMGVGLKLSQTEQKRSILPQMESGGIGPSHNGVSLPRKAALNQCQKLWSW